MPKAKKSGSAVFMYFTIGLMLVICAVCFILYYADIFKSEVVLWVGVTSFTIMYHFWLRIIMGNVTKLFGIRHSQRWFRERPFEKRLYRLLRVRRWKEKVLTYDPDAFSQEKHSLEEIANTMAKAETDHWINELISLSTLLFSLIWGEFWIFLITAVVAMIFDAQFIVVQRYNRPTVLRVIEKRKLREAKKHK